MFPSQVGSLHSQVWSSWAKFGPLSGEVRAALRPWRPGHAAASGGAAWPRPARVHTRPPSQRVVLAHRLAKFSQHRPSLGPNRPTLAESGLNFGSPEQLCNDMWGHHESEDGAPQRKSGPGHKVGCDADPRRALWTTWGTGTGSCTKSRTPPRSSPTSSCRAPGLTWRRRPRLQ